MKPTTPVEALVESYEYRLDTMAEEYEALLKEADSITEICVILEDQEIVSFCSEHGTYSFDNGDIIEGEA